MRFQKIWIMCLAALLLLLSVSCAKEPAGDGEAGGGEVLIATEVTFTQVVLEAEGLVLVDFWADWCGPCKMMAPIIEQVAAARPEVTVVKVDVDEAPVLSATYGINSIPTLLVFRDGKVLDEQIGLCSKAKVLSMLDKAE